MQLLCANYKSSRAGVPVAENKLCSSSWQGRNHPGCKHSPSPVAQQCFGEALCTSTPTSQLWMLSGLCPNPSKEQTQLHSTFPADKLCSGKSQWKEAHLLAYGCFSVWTWAVLYGGQNSMGRIALEVMYFILLHEVATISIEK